jgi:hypothetical protein
MAAVRERANSETDSKHVGAPIYTYAVRCKRCSGIKVKPLRFFPSPKWFCFECMKHFFRGRHDR